MQKLHFHFINSDEFLRSFFVKIGVCVTVYLRACSKSGVAPPYWLRLGTTAQCAWRQAPTTLAPMLVCPLPSHGMEAETGIWGGAKGTALAWAMLV